MKPMTRIHFIIMFLFSFVQSYSLSLDLENINKLWSKSFTSLALHGSSTFGKTHFILGYEPDEKEQQAIKVHNDNNIPVSINYDGSIKQIFFSPDDDVRSALLNLINQEYESIKIAIFSFTDHKIAQALLDAHKRGVNIEVITDSSCLRERYNKISLLCDHGLIVFVYNPNYMESKAAPSSVMHNKFILFNKNMLNGPLIWTGSFNFTKAACQCNQENVIVLNDQEIINKFIQQFERLKKRSFRYGAR